MVEERIYIGGLDPPHLTAQHIAERIKLLPIEIRTIEDHKDRPFCHLTVVPKEDSHSSSETTTALEIIASKYHNVKWKGCRLHIQEAKPHFLERLAEERHERQQRLEEANAMKEATVDEDVHVEEHIAGSIPRRLRIRRKFGDEAHHVDTRPWSVESWSNFSRAMAKQHKRAVKYVYQKHANPHVMPPPLMHRAVHIRFEHKDGVDHSHFQAPKIDYVDKDASSSTDMEEPEIQVVVENAPEIVKAPEELPKADAGYQWSSDEDDSDDSSAAMAQQRPFRPPSQTGEFNAGFDDEAPEELPKADAGYQWSSDEDDSDDSYAVMAQQRPFRPPSQTGEFDAGIDDDNDVDQDDDEDDDMPQVDEEAKTSNLSNDVSGNLDILASLFPEVSAVRAAVPEEDQDDDSACVEKMKPATKEKQNQNQPGFSSNGIMIRFDPMAASASQFEIEEEKLTGEPKSETSEPELSGPVVTETKDSDVPSTQDQEMEDSTEKPEEKKEETQKPKQPTNDEAQTDKPLYLYEQDKLEGVFRDARDAWQRQANVSTGAGTETGDATGGSGFSFGFDLGEAADEEEEKGTNTGFSFGFSIPESEDEQKGSDMDAQATTQEETLKRPEKRVKGTSIPTESLQRYKMAFFAANNGVEIGKDMDRFHKDPRVTEEWKKERQNLTLDWKRKHKLAQSRIQKKMKLR
eukprot:Nitzschia sp. Nitz4//scaffold57_size113557//53453//55516//NITZ4_003993-RA/size113557-processed-gene-0.157-mRNA-1//-1//CDS//3329554852//5978//frame0